MTYFDYTVAPLVDPASDTAHEHIPGLEVDLELSAQAITFYDGTTRGNNDNA